MKLKLFFPNIQKCKKSQNVQISQKSKTIYNIYWSSIKFIYVWIFPDSI